MNNREKRQTINDVYLKLDYQKNDTRYTVHNISRGGLRFSSHKIFEIDERVGITVYLPNDKTHQAKGRICYFEINKDSHEGNYYGLSFLDNYLMIT
jgi:hypothetical protein